MNATHNGENRSGLRTTVVGSYPVPDWLKAHPHEATLDDAIAIVLRAQEQAGIDVISDGELSRWDLARNAPGGMVERFVAPMSGVRRTPTFEQREKYRTRAGSSYRSRPPGVVVDAVGEGELDLFREWHLAKALTEQPLKLTVTSPYMLAKLLIDDHYHDIKALSLALADVLAGQLRLIRCTVLQIDEPHLPGSPEDHAIAAAAINRLLDTSSAAEKAVHVCFGNYGGQTIQRGKYDFLIDFMNSLHCDHLVLETTRRPDEELQMLRNVVAPMQFGMGVIDVKDLQVETPKQVAERIERMAQILGAERLRYINPDCGLQHLPRSIADAKLRAMVAGVRIFEGKAAHEPAMH